MGERRIQRSSLIVQAIEDVSYLPLDPGRFTAELVGLRRTPQYKPGGFCVFVDVPPGTYTLRLAGDRLQTRSFTVKIPLSASPPPLVAYPFLDLPGEDELIVFVLQANGGAKKLTFDPVTLPTIIRQGAVVTSDNASTVLSAPLGPGEVGEAKVDDTNGFAPGAVVRIRRSGGVRVRLDPYYQFAQAITLITGRVTLAQAAPAPLPVPLPGAEVKLTHVNGTPAQPVVAAGARVWTLDLGGGKKAVLGTDLDVATKTDGAGYYSLYFTQASFLAGVTLAVTLDGFQPQTRSEPVTPGRRKEMSFQLSKT